MAKSFSVASVICSSLRCEPTRRSARFSSHRTSLLVLSDRALRTTTDVDPIIGTRLRSPIWDRLRAAHAFLLGVDGRSESSSVLEIHTPLVRLRSFQHRKE